ncbi:MurR/RpiR family transcriptional regulator [Neobacillus cucumis]|uniref:MurR/RpiR family transcriptional regulator n=1 Tax=Neobacillus cucumis TaxID=1740721 RepID=UPI00196325EF|nr:MurR/RpiR family transcriptional regulator [Neobacillus cucumis]MBM7654529.1 DNA-binding MurR/RpiR family transcriptional regulator [Neobacillus cucumis]
MEQLIYTLLAYINNSINKDINYYIAKSLLEHIHKIESFSLDSVAEACNVAPSTINRFCKRIGFKNFSNLRHSAAIPMGVSFNEKADSELNTKAFFTKLNENIEIIENIPMSDIDRIVNQIHQSRRIVILGFEKYQIQAMELQKKLFLLGKLCECDTNLFKQIDALSDLSEEDMIITISIQGNILSNHFPIMEKLKTAKGKKLLLTFSSELHTLEIFHEILQCGKIDNSSVSSYTLLRLFDVLIHRYQRFPEFN